jgi:dihydroflavonol-4-reductase
MKVALTGVTGHLGSAVVRELRARGHRVKVLVRGSDLRCLAGIPVDLIQGDLLRTGTLPALMRDCEALIHCAGMISIDGDKHGLVRKTNIEGTQNILRIARESGIHRAIYISSIHAYEQHPKDEMLDESRSLVHTHASAYDLSKRAAQEAALAMQADDFDVIVMNPTSLIGPFDYKPSHTGRMIIDIYRGRLRFVTSGGFDFCDTRDVAHAIVSGLTMAKRGEAYILSGKWYSLKEVASMVTALSSRRVNAVCVPMVFARLGLPFVRAMSRLSSKEARYTREALDAVAYGNKCISSAKAERDLQYVARPLKDTLRDTVRWFKEMRMIDC